MLAGNDVSAVQAMAVPMPAGGEVFGTQYHPELEQTEAELHRIADDYRTLSVAPERQDLAWRYGIGPEILDPLRRSTEIGNWLGSVVRTGRRA